MTAVKEVGVESYSNQREDWKWDMPGYGVKLTFFLFCKYYSVASAVW